MFKGGKGVACFFGGFLIISPIPTLISMAVWMDDCENNQDLFPWSSTINISFDKLSNSF